MTNIAILVGNLGADPQGRTANNGTEVTTFNLGTSRPKRDSEGIERNGYEIIADEVQFLGRSRRSEAGAGSHAQSDLDDDVPF
jgi:single-stranded DNA-binding protein